MTLTSALIIVLGAMVGFGVFTALISRRSPEGSLADRTPTSIYTVTSGAISLLIAFTFSVAFAQYTNAQNATHSEAAAILQMYRAALFMEEPLRSELKADLLCYAELIVKQEWSALDAGDLQGNDQAQATLGAMDRAISHPDGVKQAGAGLSSWETGNANLITARQERFAVAAWNVPPLVYILIILGSLVTIGSLFVYADRAKPGWGHAITFIGPVFIFVAGLVVISFLDRPFIDTPGGVTPAAIQMSIDYIQGDLEASGSATDPACPTDTSTSRVFS